MKTYELGDKCPDKNCNGHFVEQESDGCCSCHICAPCGYCTNPMIECDECGFEHDTEYVPKRPNIETFKTPKDAKPAFKRTMEDLTPNKFNYLTFAGAYYFMTYKGYYPDGWDKDKLISQFNVCFGYRGFIMKDGYFEITVYTD